MRIASIDIGTNTILLLISEVTNSELRVIKEEFRIPRIGKDLSSSKIISQKSYEALIEVLIEYKKICNDYRAEKIICGGTAPFRIAENSQEIIEKVFQTTGIRIKVIGSSEESILTFIGGISNFNEFFWKKNFTVIDVGGGSTEITFGNLNHIYFHKSYEIGAVTLKEKFFYSFPYPADIGKVKIFLNEIFTDNYPFENFITIAVAGTPTTIASIILNQNEFNENDVDKMLINSFELTKLIEIFYELRPEEILTKFPSIVRGREDVILPGTIILNFLLQKLNVYNFYVSVRGIRYGLVIKELMNYENGFWTKVGIKKFLSSLNG